jgi:phosphoenolpyruvate carboxykinase (GTP)
MADYFAHWLEVGAAARDQELLPKIFYVNWFRKNAEGKWLWPGYSDNSRVLEWVFNRVAGKAGALDSPIGWVPGTNDIDVEGLDVSEDDMAELLRVDLEGWRAEVPSIREHYGQFGDRLPAALYEEVDALEKRLG